MDQAAVFTWQFEELGELTRYPGPRQALRASAICRALLMEQAPFLHRVAGLAGIKLTFEIQERPDAMPSEIVDRADMIFHNPRWQGIGRNERVKLDQLLKTKILCVEKDWLTVRDVITFVANKEGGVHYEQSDDGGPLSIRREKFASYGMRGMSLAHAAMWEIANAVLPGLEPLYQKLKV